MDLTLNGHRYSTAAKWDAFSALHVTRRLGRTLPLVSGLTRAENAGKPKDILMILLLGQLNDEDSEYVINKCLELVNRSDEKTPATRVITSGGTLMFDDLNMGDLLQISAQVLEENLGDFFRGALNNLNQAGAQ